MADPGTEMRRALGKLALFLAGCWLLLFVIGAVVAAQGTLDVPPISWALLIVSGLAFVPAAYYAITLHRAADPAEQKALLTRCAAYAAAGLLLGIATILILRRINGS